MVRNPSYPRLPMSYAFHEYDGPIAFLADPEDSQHHSSPARPLFPACEESRGARSIISERTRLPRGVSAAAWIRTEYSTARTQHTRFVPLRAQCSVAGANPPEASAATLPTPARIIRARAVSRATWLNPHRGKNRTSSHDCTPVCPRAASQDDGRARRR